MCPINSATTEKYTTTRLIREEEEQVLLIPLSTTMIKTGHINSQHNQIKELELHYISQLDERYLENNGKNDWTL